MTESISMEAARKVMIAATGLDRMPGRPVKKTDVLDCIRRMQLLQIDTIHVIARSPYLVLWSRLGDYATNWLDELLAEGALFEYWSHAMCFIPIEDYPLYVRRMMDAIHQRGWPAKWAVQFKEEHPELIERIRGHILENGPVRSAEFENKNHSAGGWWNWKEEKDALESMLFTGEVMISQRKNFQRVYDLRERVLPGWDQLVIPSTEELHRELALRSVYALGLAKPNWAADYFREAKKFMPKMLKALAAEGALIEVEVEGVKGPVYTHPERQSLIDAVLRGEQQPANTTLLSPFDPLVWDRDRARELFNFDYTIECYTPPAKRIYGYLNLPILHDGKLVGRLDPKAHRSDKIFEVKSLHLEPGVKMDDYFISSLADALRRLAEWHHTPEVVIRQSNPPELASLLSLRL